MKNLTHRVAFCRTMKAMILLSTTQWWWKSTTRFVTTTLALSGSPGRSRPFHGNSNGDENNHIMNSNTAHERAAATPSTSRRRRRRRRRIVDTDAGFDDVVAIQSLLAHGYSVDLVTTVCGSNTAVNTHEGLGRLFPQLTIVPSDNRSRPTQAWLTDFRQRFANFVQRHGVTAASEETQDKESTVDASCSSSSSTMRVQTFLESSRDESVDLLCLGPLSNVADWCRTFPDLLQAKVATVWILGGAHPGMGRTDEFNFGQDASAAHLVLQSTALRRKIYLVPGDATSHDLAPPSFIDTIMNAVQQAPVSEHDQRTLNASTTLTNDNLLANVVREEQYYSIFYDPVCIFLYLNPHAAQFPRVLLNVCPNTGVTQFMASTNTTATTEASTEDDTDAIPVAEQVNFDAYQTWLLEAIRRSVPPSS